MRWSSVWIAAVLAGCYSYERMDTPIPAVGQDVSLDVTRGEAERLAPRFGPEVRTLTGRIVDASDSGVTLVVTATTDRRSFQAPWKDQRVEVPREAIEALRERKLSLGRSALLGGAIVSAGVGAAAAFSGGGSGPPIAAGGPGQTSQ